LAKNLTFVGRDEIIPEATVLSDRFSTNRAEISTNIHRSKMFFTASIEAIVNHLCVAIRTQWRQNSAKYTTCGEFKIIGIIFKNIQKRFKVRKIY